MVTIKRRSRTTLDVFFDKGWDNHFVVTKVNGKWAVDRHVPETVFKTTMSIIKNWG